MAYLPQLFERAAEPRLANIAVVEDANRWTFAELVDEVNRTAAVLKERIKGETVGVLLLNSQKYIATMLAIWKAGKTAVPLNYLLPPAELGFIIKDSGRQRYWGSYKSIRSAYFLQFHRCIESWQRPKGISIYLPCDFRSPGASRYRSPSPKRFRIDLKFRFMKDTGKRKQLPS